MNRISPEKAKACASGKGVFDGTNARVRGGDDAGVRAQPVIRARIMLFGLCALIVIIAGPLSLVWKQSYINHASIRLQAKSDTLDALNREVKALTLRCNRLSEPARVERVARSRGLEYPASRQLEILEVKPPRRERGIGGIIVRVAQFISGE